MYFPPILKHQEAKTKRPPAKIVKKYTNKESLHILKELLVHGRATNELYTLLGLWLTGLISKPQYSHLKHICNNSIDVFNIRNNHKDYQELINDIILEMITVKLDGMGEEKGYKHKISWDKVPMKQPDGSFIYLQLEGNEGKIVSYIFRGFKQMLYKVLGKHYRGGISYSEIYQQKKKNTELQRLRERVKDELDSGIMTFEMCQQLKSEGFDDETMSIYRYAYSLGRLRSYTTLTEKVEVKHSLDKQVSGKEPAELMKKKIYDEVFNILNSKLMPKKHREFLKCFYEIPSIVVDDYGRKKLFTPSMYIFFEQFPEYNKVLKAKRIAYHSTRKIVKYVDNGHTLKNSKIFKESHEMMRALLKPRLISILGEYKDKSEDSTVFKSFETNNHNLWSEDVIEDPEENEEDLERDEDEDEYANIVGDLSDDDMDFIDNFRDDF